MQARIIVSGIVQGVSFRSFAKKHAHKLQLNGFVRNLPDGSLEVITEGKKEKIEELIKEIRKGPEGSKVDNIKIEWRRDEGYEGFSIKI